MQALSQYRDQVFNLDQLVRTVGGWLEGAAASPRDRRVAQRPDARTVRYYQTIGVLPKPLRYDGRQAVYGYVHLLQLISVKWLQAQGYTLAQIKDVLAPATVRTLEEVLRTAFKREGRRGVEGPPDAQALSTPPEAMGRPGAITRDLSAYELAPGMTLIIDPQQVSSPSQTAQWIATCLRQGEDSTG